MRRQFRVAAPSLDEVCRAAVVAARQTSKAASLLAGGLRALKNAF